MTLKHLWCHQYHISGLEMRREKGWRDSKMCKSINSTRFTPRTQNKWSWKKAWPASYISAGAYKIASGKVKRWNNFAAGDVCLQLVRPGLQQLAELLGSSGGSKCQFNYIHSSCPNKTRAQGKTKKRWPVSYISTTSALFSNNLSSYLAPAVAPTPGFCSL